MRNEIISNPLAEFKGQVVFFNEDSSADFQDTVSEMFINFSLGHESHISSDEFRDFVAIHEGNKKSKDKLAFDQFKKSQSPVSDVFSEVGRVDVLSGRGGDISSPEKNKAGIMHQIDTDSFMP